MKYSENKKLNREVLNKFTLKFCKTQLEQRFLL